MQRATYKNISKLYDYQISDTTVYRHLKLLRDALNRPKPKVITIEDYKLYFL
jgi:hypothetical protein